MSRGLDLADHRDVAPTGSSPAASRPDRPRERGSRDIAPAFRLPSGTRREPVLSRGRTYQLRGSESQTLQTVGTFRVVFERDLADAHDAVDRRTLAADLESLVAQGLAERRALAANRAGRSLRVVALTPAAHQLLDDHRDSWTLRVIRSPDQRCTAAGPSLGSSCTTPASTACIARRPNGSTERAGSFGA